MFAITPSSSSGAQEQQQQQQQPQNHLLLHQQMQSQQLQQQQQQQQLLKQQQQQQAIIQQAMLQQQAALYHPALLAAMSQIEPIPSGNLPPGFDATSCRSVYVGNIHPKVTEALLAEVFTTIGPLAGCKLIRKEKSSYGFVDYLDHRAAAAAILSLNGREIFTQPIKVNWAYASGQREDTSGHFNVFVGDLGADVTDAALFTFFSIYSSCSDARVMWDQRTGRSRGFGFVSFRNQQDAEKAITEMTGKWLGTRAIRCNWATKTGTSGQGDETSTGAGASNLSAPVDGSLNPALATEAPEAEGASKENPDNNAYYTTVYVGNLAHEVTQAELHRHFLLLGAGIIEDVRVQREKGFGFVRYRTHEEAELAIQLANGRIIGGKSVKCSWGTKPTLPGTSGPLTAPGAAPMMPLQGLMGAGLSQGYTTADLLAYQRQLALVQSGANAILPLPGQQGLNMGLGGGGMGLGSRTGFENLQMGLGPHQLL